MDTLINNVWLTVNRACNFRCKWCYAKNTKYAVEDNMSIKLAKKLIDFSKEIGVQSITLIGGEPTVHPDILEIVKYIKGKDLHLGLITNGYLLSNIKFLSDLKRSGLDMIGFSLKAANRQQQFELTGNDCFDKITSAMRNLSRIKDIQVTYSTVISKVTIGNIDEFAKIVSKNDPLRRLKLSFCNPYFGECVNSEYVLPREEIIKKIVKVFPIASKILKNRIILRQSFPECFWPESFLKELQLKNQLSFGCHVMRKGGLIFDTQGKVLVCNNLPNYPIGLYGESFIDKKSFYGFWESNEVNFLYAKFYEYPSTKCVSCAKYFRCAGGCALKWFAYNGLPKKEESFYGRR
mgnify:CR=1 FL=1